MRKLSQGQELFNTLHNVADFTALESDMMEIVMAVEKDNVDVFEEIFNAGFDAAMANKGRLRNTASTTSKYMQVKAACWLKFRGKQT